MNFVAIDFETAERHHICAVGIVTVENVSIVDEYYALVKPPNNKYSWRTKQIHGIQESDTENSPSFIEVYPEIHKRISNKTVIAHNESFDRNTLIKSMIDNELNYSDLKLPDRWECTMKLCRANDRYPSGKLNECCAVEGIKLNHHEALSDARACALLYLEIKSTTTT